MRSRPSPGIQRRPVSLLQPLLAVPTIRRSTYLHLAEVVQGVRLEHRADQLPVAVSTTRARRRQARGVAQVFYTRRRLHRGPIFFKRDNATAD